MGNPGLANLGTAFWVVLAWCAWLACGVLVLVLDKLIKLEKII